MSTIFFIYFITIFISVTELILKHILRGEKINSAKLVL